MQELIDFFEKFTTSKIFHLADHYLGNDEEKKIGLLSQLGGHFYRSGNLGKAAVMFERSVALSQHFFGIDHPTTGMLMGNIGSIYLLQGKFKSAEKNLENALIISQKPKDPDLSDVGTCMTNLGLLYIEQGRFKKAKVLLERALDISKKAETQDYSDISLCINNLGTLYLAQGDYSTAEHLFLDALETSKKCKTENLHTKFNRLNNLGVLYSTQGRLADAAHFQEKSLKIAELTNNPLSIIRAMQCLGIIYFNQGNHSDAEDNFLNALNKINEFNISECSVVGSLLTSLGSLYMMQGRHIEAIPLFQIIIQSNKYQTDSIIHALCELIKISFNMNEKIEINIKLAQAWNILSESKNDDSYLDEEAFRLAITEINCWNLLDNPFKSATETSHKLRERLNLISEANRPFWTEKLHKQYTEFHVKWLQHCLADNLLESIPFILSLVSGWRATQFLLDEIDTAENTSTLPPEVIQLKQWRKQLHGLRLQIQALANPSPEQAAQRVHFSPEGIAEQEQRLQQLYADYDVAKNEMFRVQQALAQLPEYAALATDIGIDITELRANLKPRQAIALCVDFPAHNFRGVLLVFSDAAKIPWIDLSSFDSGEGASRLDYFNRTFGGGRGFRRGDFSAAEASVQTEELNSINCSANSFWPEFKHYIEQGFWSHLRHDLEGIEEVVLITQGGFHSLPLELGKPENLGIVRYPSVTLHKMQQVKRSPTAEEKNILGLAHSNDPNIWFAKQEAIAIAKLYEASEHRVIKPFDFVSSEEPVTAVHIAGHGFHHDAHAHHAGLDMGGTELWTQPKLLASKARPTRVFISACVAGKTTENSEGDVYGIAAIFMLRGTRELTAAVVNMNDPWMFLMGYQVEEYLLLNPTHSQHQALQQAKADLLNNKPIPDAVLNSWKDRARDDLAELINCSAAGSDNRRQKIKEFIQFNTTLCIEDELKFAERLLALSNDEVIEDMFNSNQLTFLTRPPEPILGALLYGILHFGK